MTQGTPSGPRRPGAGGRDRIPRRAAEDAAKDQASGGMRPAAARRPRPAKSAASSAAKGASAKSTAGRTEPRKVAWAQPPKRRSRFTGRAAILALILAGLVLAYAQPTRVYLAQRAEIARLESDQAEQGKRIAQLTEQREKWNDPEYVAAQARQRLGYVRPGDVTYIVVEDPPPADPGAGGTARPGESGPWYDRVWTSVLAANGAGPP